MTLLLDNDAVSRVMDPGEMVMALDAAYRDFATGGGVCAPRLDFQSPADARGENYQMGVALGLDGGRYGAIRIKSDRIFKEIVNGQPRKEKYCVSPGTYLGLILLFDQFNGALLAIMHDGLVQQMRVGCDSAIGVRYMARTNSETLGILGAGGMAASHAAAMTTVRPLKRILVYSPTPANRESFASRFGERLGIDVIAVDGPEAVFREADIVSACTNAIGPVVFGRMLRPGMHLTCIGGTLDAEASERVDLSLRLGNATAPAGFPNWDFEDECMIFANGGSVGGHGGTRRFADIPSDRRLTLADLLSGAGARASDDQITFSERGNIHGVQFAAAAGMIFERAVAAGVGRELPADMFLESIRN